MSNKKTELATRDTSVATYTAEQVELIKNTVAKGATNDELQLFMAVAKRSGLDPFTKQIHFVKRPSYNSKTGQYESVGAIQTGIDGYRAIAERSGTLAGIDDAIFEDKDNMPIKASVTVYRFLNGERVPFTASARFSEYAQKKKEGGLTGMWVKMPYLMLGKCAEALALRKAFPNDLSGLYTNEEMAQADTEPTQPQPTAKVVRPHDPILESKQEIMALVRTLKPDIAKEGIEQYIIDETTLTPIDANLARIISELTKKVNAKMKERGQKAVKAIAEDSGRDEDYGMEKFGKPTLPEDEADVDIEM